MKAIVITFITFLLSMSSALAQEKLILVIPGAHSLASDYIDELGKEVAKASNGAVEFDVRYSAQLANLSNVFDRLRDDVIQIGWGFLGYLPDQFSLTQTISLPFVVDDSVVGSVALWRLYKTGALDTDYKEFIPLMLGPGGINYVHFAKPLRVVDDFSGRKVSVGGRIQSEALQVFGGTPISLQAIEVYEAMNRGTIDGTVLPWSAFPTNKLIEVTAYHVEVPLGAPITGFFMARKRFDKLPAAARKVIEEHSRQEINSLRFAQALEKMGSTPRDQALSQPDKHQIVQLPPEKAEIWKQKVTAAIYKPWFEKYPGSQKVLDEYLKLYAEAKAGK